MILEKSMLGTVQENLVSCWKSLHAKGYQYLSKNGFTYCFSEVDFPLFNSILEVPNPNNSSYLETLITQYKKRNNSHLFWIPEHYEPHYKPILEKNNYQYFDQIHAIVFDLNKYSLNDLKPYTNLGTKIISHQEFTNKWSPLAKKVYELSNEVASFFHQLQLSTLDNTHWKNYIYSENNTHISCLSMFQGNNKTAGIYNGGTLPSHRKKGIMTNLIKRSLYEAKIAGNEKVIAQANNQSLRLCKKLGGNIVGNYKLYLYQPK